MRIVSLGSMFLAVAAMTGPTRPSEAGSASPPLPTPVLRPITANGESRDLSEAAREIAAAGAKAEQPLDKAHALLSAANLVLARTLEPAASDRFLQIERDDPQRDTLVNESIARAEEFLVAAHQALDQSIIAEGDDDAAVRKQELDHHHQTLTAFAGALAAYFQLPQGDEPRSPRRAASELSPLLEDANAQVASAAAFWQACLRAMDPDPSAALSALEPVTNDLPSEGDRYAFFSRLLRCRLLAARGGEPAAASLLMQAEERINDWFKLENERLDAIRTIGFLQMQILRSWYDRLTAEQSDERAWCAARIARLSADLFATPMEAPVMRLELAVPIVVRPAPAPSPKSGEAPQP